MLQSYNVTGFVLWSDLVNKILSSHLFGRDIGDFSYHKLLVSDILILTEFTHWGLPCLL